MEAQPVQFRHSVIMNPTSRSAGFFGALLLALLSGCASEPPLLRPPPPPEEPIGTLHEERGIRLIGDLGIEGGAPVAAPGPTPAAAVAPSAGRAFVLGQQGFRAGDSIVIEQVSSSSPNFGVGDRVVVRGRYVLGSQAEAMLGLSLTTRDPVRTRISPRQRMPVSRGPGQFELEIDVQAVGSLHLSFSPMGGGSSFGNVYFGPGP